MIDKLALLLVIIGALNWGMVGLFGVDAVVWAFGSSASIMSRIIYSLVALGGIWSITMLFRDRDNERDRHAARD